jgi:hypothetical protein
VDEPKPKGGADWKGELDLVVCNGAVEAALAGAGGAADVFGRSEGAEGGEGEVSRERRRADVIG